MDPQSVSSIFASQQPTTPAPKSDVLGKEDFLKMLTAQMKFQNPLDPLKDNEFIAQMTQFSSLEQLQNMNESLTNSSQWNMLLSQTINNTMATSLIGKTITADAAGTTITSDGASPITFTSAEFALNGTIMIYNSAGELVRSLPVSQLSAGEHAIEWNGKDNQGNDLPAGSYRVDVSLRSTNGSEVAAQTFMRGLVEGVEYIDGQAYLLVNGGMIPLAQVRHVSGG